MMLATSRPVLGLLEHKDDMLYSRMHHNHGMNGKGQHGPYDSERDPRPASPRIVRLACGAPAAIEVGTHFARLTWPALDTTEELKAGVSYTLEVQLVDHGKGGADVPWRVCYLGPQTICEVSEKLRAGRTYLARVSAIVEPIVSSSQPTSKDGEEDGPDPVPKEVRFEVQVSRPGRFQTIATAPAAPQPPSLAARARNALKLKWNSPDEPGGEAPLTYVLQISPAPQAMEGSPPVSEGFVEVYRGAEKAYKVAKLQAGVRYTVRIKAFNHLGESPLSLCSAYTTQASVPSQPDPPKPVASTSSSITLEWVPPLDNGAPISAYQLEQDGGFAGSEFNLVFAGQQTCATASGLQSGLSYRFRLRADNSEGKSIWSEVVTATTAAQPPACPVAITLVASDRGAATVAWSPAADNGGSVITGYEVQLQAKTRAAVDHMGTDWLPIFLGEATACTINSLRPGCTYRVRIRASNAVGFGQYCFPLDVVTAADVPEMAGEPYATAVLPHSVSLQWAAPKHDGGARIITYRVELAEPACTCGACTSAQPRQCDSTTIKLVHSGEANSAEVGALEPGCRYQFRVQPTNSQGPGPWTVWAPVATPAAPPLECPTPIISRAGPSSFHARWAAPHAQGAAITTYTLDLARVGPAPPLVNPGAMLHPHLEQPLSFRTVYRGPEPAYEVRSLEPTTLYALRVAAANVTGTGPWSANAAVATAPAPPGAPEALVARAAGSHAVSLNWQPPVLDNGAAVTTYVVEYQNVSPSSAGPSNGVGGGRPRSSNAMGGAAGTAGAANSAAPLWHVGYQGSATVCTVAGLQPGRSYMFRSKAANTYGFGPFSVSTSGMTGPAPPSAPGRPAAGLRTAIAVRLRWEEVLEDNGAPVSDYTVEQSSDGGESWERVHVGRETVHRVTGLLPGRRYLFRTSATNSAGTSPYSPIESVITLLSAPSAPTAVSATLAEPTAVDASGVTAIVRWVVPGPSESTAEPMSYEVMAAASGEMGSVATVRQTVAGGTSTECRLQGLQAGMQYAIRMRSVGADATGHSGWSTEALLVTPGVAGLSSHRSSLGDADMRSVCSEASTISNMTASGRQGRPASLPPRKGSQATSKRKGPVPPPPHHGAASTSGDSEDTPSAATTSHQITKRGQRSLEKRVPVGPVAAAKAPPLRRSMHQRVWRVISKHLWQIALVVLVVLALCFALGER